MGETLAERTITKLSLGMDATTLKANVTAKSKPDTVLIDVAVLDESPVQARDVVNALSEEFVRMVQELETPSPGARPDARVVIEQRARVPERPVTPKPVRNVFLGVFLGGLLGLGLALVRDRLDNTVKSEEILKEVAGTSVVGYIPYEKMLQGDHAISFDTDSSPAAEAFRKLRTNLQFLDVDNPPKMIVVTSPSPSEGKTTTSINAALALAEAGYNVVLVDGDLRRPRLAKYLDVVGSVGFSTALSGAAPVNDVLQQTKYPRLTILAAGAIPPNPSELLSSMSAKRILSELRSQFDYVLIDSAPLLAVTDGAILAAEADGALIAVRAGKTKREQLSHAIGMLNDVGTNILGAVLTMVPIRGSGAYSYSYYQYSGRYGDRSPVDFPSGSGDPKGGGKVPETSTTRPSSS